MLWRNSYAFVFSLAAPCQSLAMRAEGEAIASASAASEVPQQLFAPCVAVGPDAATAAPAAEPASVDSTSAAPLLVPPPMPTAVPAAVPPPMPAAVPAAVPPPTYDEPPSLTRVNSVGLGQLVSVSDLGGVGEPTPAVALPPPPQLISQQVQQRY